MTQERPEKIRCDACPVLCYIAPGQTGACDRYANMGGRIVRSDPVTVLDRTLEGGGAVVPFAAPDGDWDGGIAPAAGSFVTGIGAGTTYPDYKPAPFIVSREIAGVDTVTVVTEAIFSYCGVKVKIDTDRHLGPEAAIVRAEGEAIGHVTTGRIRQPDAVARRRRASDGRLQGRGTRDLRRIAGTLQPRAGGTRHRRRSGGHRAGGRGPGGRRGHRVEDAGRLRLGDHRHVRRPVARQGGRGGCGGRSHHRRRLRASGRQGAGLGADRDPHQGAALDAGAVFPGVRAGARAGAGRGSPIPRRSLAPSIRRRVRGRG